MSYSESADFEEKKQSISAMEQRFMEANIELNWEKLVVLDIGGAGGLHSGLLSKRVKRIYCADIVDCSSQYNGEFLRLLKEKFDRNGFELAINKLEFNTTSATDLIFRDNYFDLIVSFNAFEHIPDPELAIREAARALKPKGYIYITFDPIWTADTGSHFYHLIPHPWQHLLSSDQEYANMMRGNGANDFDVQDFLHGINRVRLSDYRQIFDNLVKTLGLLTCFHITWSGLLHEYHLTHQNYNGCLLSGYSKEELLLRGMSYIFQKVE